MFELSLFIPLQDNEKVAFSAAHFAQFESVLLDLFGGFSRRGTTINGAWLDAGVRYDDNLVEYIVAVGSIVDGQKVAEAAKRAAAHFDQLAIYVRYLGQAEIIER